MKEYLRGHEIEQRGEEFVYVDTEEPAADTWKDRDCGYCGLGWTREGHDGCLGELPGIMNACCGHGCVREAYIQYPDRSCIRGVEALVEMVRLKAEE